ncbi:MAG: hypothetical protein HZA68_17570 [Rhodovulum sp.]|nr:hypothetical protein [Rhodovulum sp.]
MIRRLSRLLLAWLARPSSEAVDRRIGVLLERRGFRFDDAFEREIERDVLATAPRRWHGPPP